MGGPKSKASSEDILAAFSTAEPFKAAAVRLGMSPNTLRGIWKGAFGEEAFTARGKKIQAEAAAKVCRETAADRTYKAVQIPCSRCGEQVTLRSNQVAQMDVGAFVCEGCRCDRVCPVCGLQVDGERGLSGHFRHRREAGDKAHMAYLEAQEGTLWSVGTPGEDYVACLVCGHRSESLARHLTAVHGITASEYRSKYGLEAPVLSQKASRAMAEAARNRSAGGYEGTKRVACPGCGQSHDVHKLAGARVPCKVCREKAEVIRRAVA